METIKNFYNKYEKYINLLITVIPTLFAGFIWINSTVEDQMNKKIKPFEDLLIGLSSVQYGNYEKGIISLDKAYEKLIKESGNESMLVSILDPYIESLARVDHPAKYWGNFNKIKSDLTKNCHLMEIGIFI